MTIARTIIMAALLACPIAAVADPGPLAPIKVTAVKPAKDPNALVCKTIEEMGSLIKTQRVCATTAEWKEHDFRAGQWTERMSSTRWLYGGN